MQILWDSAYKTCLWKKYTTINLYLGNDHKRKTHGNRCVMSLLKWGSPQNWRGSMLFVEGVVCIARLSKPGLKKLLFIKLLVEGVKLLDCVGCITTLMFGCCWYWYVLWRRLSYKFFVLINWFWTTTSSPCNIATWIINSKWIPFYSWIILLTWYFQESEYLYKSID